MTRKERAAQIAAFDAEADAERPGWIEAKDSAPGVWCTGIRGNIGQVFQIGDAWCWVVLDGEEPSRIILKGVSTRRGWAMDACEIEAPQSH